MKMKKGCWKYKVRQNVSLKHEKSLGTFEM